MQKDTSLNFANVDHLLLAAGFKKSQGNLDLFCGACHKKIYSNINKFETIYVNEHSVRFELLCSECGRNFFKAQ